MPGWSSGTFSRGTAVHSGSDTWSATEGDGTGITSSDHDTHDEGLAQGINSCLTKDGQNSPTGNLPMGGFRHTNVDAASARSQYGRVAEIQDTGGYTWAGDSSGSANAQTLSPSMPITTYANGQRFRFRSAFNNTGATTINIGGVGAVTLYRPNGATFEGGELRNGGQYEITYLAGYSGFVLSSTDRPTLTTRDVGGAAYSNSTAENQIYSATIKANTLAQGVIAHLRGMGTIGNSSGGSITYTFRLKLDGSTVCTAAFSVATGATTTYYEISSMLIGGAGSSQFNSFSVTGTTSLGAPTFAMDAQSSALDPTIDHTLALTCQMGTASASASVYERGTYLEFK